MAEKPEKPAAPKVEGTPKPEKAAKPEKADKPEKAAKPAEGAAPAAAPAAAAPAGTAPATAEAPAGEAEAKKKKIKRLVPKAIAHVLATFNNTMITVTDLNGETLCWASAGTIGYKGSRKSTPFAAQKAAESVADKAKRFGVREVDVRVKGPGSGRESAVRAIQASGIIVRAIEDVTPLPHNGCRPRKKRRV
ncbi:MAG: 30S ribosomal protein S11 [Planctomycetes bacterium]|nr:30S ribosomal protein S11 [Planctomycetota bacterium]